jgi:hypothetical protein
MAKLDLTGKNKIDSLKAELPLGDDEKVCPIQPTPMLKIDEPNQTVGDLSAKLAEVYINPIFDAMKKLDDDRKKLLSISGEQWYDSFSQKKLEELQGILGNSSISAAFKTAQDYSAYTKPILESLSSKHFDSLQKLLGVDYQSYLKPEYSQAFAAITQLGNTLQSPSIQKTLSEIMGTHSYLPQLGESITKLSHNEDLLNASQSLNVIGKALSNDSFKHRMEDHAAANLRINPIEMPNIVIPKNPMIEQNNKLIEVAQIQNSMLKDIHEEMQIQNSYTDQSVQELKKQSQGISEQIGELKKQNEKVEQQISQKDTEIKESKKSSYLALGVAFFSILISAVASYMSYKATYDIYEKEKADSDKMLLEKLEESTMRNYFMREFQK